jgi:hypothetical protein
LKQKLLLHLTVYRGLMTMELDDYIKFANENPVSYFATADGDQPRVRGLLLWYAEKTG